MNKTFMIFNFHQANFLLQEGCKVVECGYGKIDGKPYLKFEGGKLLNSKLKEWRIRRK